MTMFSAIFLRVPFDSSVWRPIKRWLCCLLLLIGITACGMDNTDAPRELAGMAVTLQAGTPAANAHAGLAVKHDNPNANNLLGSLDGLWRGWVTQQSQITYDNAANVLLIPAATAGEDMVIGVRRYEQALATGETYTLRVESDNPQTAALIFLQLADGQIVPAALNTSGGLALATRDNPVTFVVSGQVLAFYLQVQNQWQPDMPTSLTAGLTQGGPSDDNNGQPIADDELITLAGDWLNWNGQPDGVLYDAANQRLNVSPPSSRSAYSIGTRLFSIGLNEGANYTFSLPVSSDPQAAALLFLIGPNNQLVPFNNPTPWLAVFGGESVTFTAAAGIQALAVQVQSGANATGDSYLRPSLRPGGEIQDDNQGNGGSNQEGNQDNNQGGNQSSGEEGDGSEDGSAGGASEGGASGENGNTNSAAMDQQRLDFQQNLMARRAFDCLTTTDPDYPSFQWIDTYTAEFLVSDGFFYASTDCGGIPYSNYLPLNIRRYTLGDRLTLADGRTAWEINFEVLLEGESGGEPTDQPAGTMLYDIVSLVDDDTFYATSAESTDPAGRPLDLSTGEPGSVTRIGPLGKPDLVPADIAGPWVRECGDTGGSTTRSVFTYGADTSTVRVTGYTDTSCTESYFSYEIDRSITYGVTAPGALGDHILPVVTTVTRAEYTNLAVGSDLPPFPALPDVGSMNYGGVSLLNDTLMFTDCLFFSPCGRTASAQTDIIDFYSGKRFIRLEAAANQADTN